MLALRILTSGKSHGEQLFASSVLSFKILDLRILTLEDVLESVLAGFIVLCSVSRSWL
jgi:hypothetical protein